MLNKKLAWPLIATAGGGVALGLLYPLRQRAARRLRRDATWLFAQAADAPGQTYHEAQLAGLPAPVQRYFRHVLREGQPYLRGLRLRHGGQFKTDLKKDWLAIEGQQYVTADPAGFIWQGTTRWFRVRDEYVAGRGSLLVRLLGAVQVVSGSGPHYDEGELLRWLVESPWLPTNLLPSSRVAWTAVDDRSARLTFSQGGQSVACLMGFNEQDEIATSETQRYIDETTRVPWVCSYAQYRRWHGMLIPTDCEASYVVDGQRQPYAHFVVQELDYEPLRPF
ncbi:DUF6544 family protein [Hymenobacter sp. PAMC 26628]|uniref:DUF6544 family protein n=1 Tax=Hymenobacter sp. PAMC 26628 TaxID=1484118 RepID=UPI0007701951|nr:DUF6544 family protein [Hymenobacter sp. PAMC 26628]AMJ65981.1 hypothetical protein AXW84_11465 [Hymenobacter sp. PAMC 26628]